MSDGLVAMQLSLVPRTARVRLLPVIAGHPVPGSRLLHGIAVSEVHAPRPLEQVPGGRRHIAELRRSAREDRAVDSTA